MHCSDVYMLADGRVRTGCLRIMHCLAPGGVGSEDVPLR